MPKSNIYTATGDRGTTSLVGGTRVAKDNPRLEAYGTVDELNSWIALLASITPLPDGAPELLATVQHRLFDIGSALATEPQSSWQPAPFPDSAVREIETHIDTLDATLPRHNRFILPGGSTPAAQTNIARTVARRAERRIISLAAHTAVDPTIIRYINRLSDYLFVLARAINKINGVDEIFWEKLS